MHTVTSVAKRADKRTPRDIAIAQLTRAMEMPDRDLCQINRATGLLPQPHNPCGTNEICDDGSILVCGQPGEWAIHTPGIGARRACTRHAAKNIRDMYWLNRQRLKRMPT